MGQHMAYSAISQEPVPPMAVRVSPWSVYRLFETSDEELVFIGITSDRHWRRFCESFDREDLLHDESLATNNDRVEARERLLPELETMFATLTLAEIVNVQLPDGRQTKLPRLPLALDGERAELRSEAPGIGQHSQAILLELGYGQAAIDELHESEIIVALPEEINDEQT